MSSRDRLQGEVIERAASPRRSWLAVLALLSIGRIAIAESLPQNLRTRAEQSIVSAAYHKNVAEELLPPLPPESVTLEEVEQLALATHPALHEMVARVESLRGRWVQAGLPPNPIIGYSGEQLGSNGQAEQNGILLGKEFVRGGKLRLNRAVAAREIEVAEQQLEATRRRILTDVRLGFYDLLVSQRRRALNDELLHLSQEAVETSEALLRAQTVSRVDVLQAQIEMDQARIEFQNSDNRKVAAARELASLIGQDLPFAEVRGSLDNAPLDLDWQATLDRLLMESPEVATAMAEVGRAERALQRACVEPIPNMTVQGVYQHDASQDATNGNLQLSMPLPIHNRNQGAIREARGELVSARHALERVQADLKQRLAQVFERYTNARNQVELYSTHTLPASKESLRLTLRGQQSGEFGFITVLRAQQTFFHISRSYLESQRELWMAVLEIDGLLLSGSLRENR